MQEQIEALASRMQELILHVRQLREENHRLRTELATSQAEAAQLRERMTHASSRIDRLLETMEGGDTPGAQG
jgi:outer membrane murein-binding lipoprotein Lpp